MSVAPRTVCLLSLFALACGTPMHPSLTDKEVHLPPDYLTFRPPARGAEYVDPVFGSTIRRLSDARQTRDAVTGAGPLAFITNEYSTVTPFNRDATRLLVQHQSYFALYDGEGHYVEDLPKDVNAASEPRWSRHDPDVFYYLAGNELRRYHVGQRAASLVRRFSEYGRVSGNGESDLCFDGDHLALVGDARFVFVYELSTGRKGAALDTGGRGIDSVHVTPDDQVTVTWLQSGTGRQQGVELYSREMDFLRQVARAGGHMDVARDLDGRGVLVWANAADPQPICPNGVVKIRLTDGVQTCLLSLDWSLALHVSGVEAAGWAFVETYAPSDPAPVEGRWAPYANEILQIRLDGSEVRRLAHHRSRPFDSYNYMPRVSADRAGRRLVFSSNHGLQQQLGYPATYTDVYLVRAPD
jgi:hypothetical protein